MSGALASAYRGLAASAQEVAASGRPVVGIVGRDVPAVLVAAAGAHPFRLGLGPWPEDPSSEATDLMGRAVDRSALLVLSAVLTGSLDFLRGILLAHDSEATVRLYYALQELHRRGRTSLQAHMVDQVHLDRPSTLRFNTAQLDRLCDVLGRWGTQDPTHPHLEMALAEHAGTRAALATLQRARRDDTRVDGHTALHAYAVAACLPATEAVALIAAPTLPTRVEDSLPVFLTGSAPLDDDVYRVVESAGAVVVGEDHDWGDPILTDVLPERLPPERGAMLHELALSRLRGAPAAASASMAARAAATRRGVADSGARGLLAVIRAHDDAPRWDWARQRVESGVPAAQVRDEEAGDPDAIRHAIETLRTAS